MHKDVSEVPFTLGGAPAVPGVWTPPEDPEETSSASRMQQIIGVLEDPEETDLAGAMRLLAVEIAFTLSPGPSGVLAQDARNANNRIKNLRELSKQIQESADMSSRDYLNFDGPRFQFLFKELVLLFRASVVKGGLTADTADHILRVFLQEFLSHEAELRRATTKLDPAAPASSSSFESILPPAPETKPIATGDSNA